MRQETYGADNGTLTMVELVYSAAKRRRPAAWPFIMALAACVAATGALAKEPAAGPEPSESETLFLQRLMMAESGGRLNAKNPNSSAFGPFQFIESTFYEVVTRHLPEVAKDKSYAEIQVLRADLETARSAALAYTRENAAFFDERGIAPEAGYLRLAFLLGPSGAEAVISAEPETPLSDLLSSRAIAANPFMNGMSAQQLIERARREAAGLKPLPVTVLRQAAAAHPRITVRCNLKLASCRKWLFLAEKRLARQAHRK